MSVNLLNHLRELTPTNSAFSIHSHTWNNLQPVIVQASSITEFSILADNYTVQARYSNRAVT